MSIEQFYAERVKSLPRADGLRLATLILNDIAPWAVVDHSEEWTDEDRRDAARYSLQRAAASLGEKPDDV